MWCCFPIWVVQLLKPVWPWGYVLWKMYRRSLMARNHPTGSPKLIFMQSSELVNQKQSLDEIAAAYAKEVVDLLTTQLINVIKQRQPEILPYFDGTSPVLENNKELLPGVMQAWGIWFQF